MRQGGKDLVESLAKFAIFNKKANSFDVQSLVHWYLLCLGEACAGGLRSQFVTNIRWFVSAYTCKSKLALICMQICARVPHQTVLLVALLHTS